MIISLIADLIENNKPIIVEGDRTFKKAKDYIFSNIDKRISMAELCQYVGVSERKMRYVFKSQTGVSPKQFLNGIRLNRVRHELKVAPSVANVMDAALKCGFWHLGQFSADYNRLFGELPSQTLGKCAM